jgi:hypothetical protein
VKVRILLKGGCRSVGVEVLRRGIGDRFSNFEGESIIISTPEWITKGLNNLS